ncbi:hypothetical protein IE81DRAFT_222175 [Ceraceosorus guamensis]|uniref:Small RNA 2'-O-methyltransferase n=1 Tax=Ceraceosorus guamensis TaxID=1522189 RepID=A0A316VT76_9BASI|nr:hypothetical protein IE81DRAFT_222175 [Ceraceosorus guamensis]PWN40424.1 hypothetical protein IE81DRAFT_222175 [Ceraceosorus guamensis]
MHAGMAAVLCHSRLTLQTHPQRQAWILELLRKHQPSSIVDIGCGEGTLLSALCRPPLQRDVFPLHRLPSLTRGACPLPSHHWIYSDADLSCLTSLIGVDIDARALAAARTAILAAQGYRPMPRWMPFTVHLLHGTFETLDHRLVGCDAIVATEVIEHLADISKFAPILLGMYKPKLLIITTPDYNFNLNFHPEWENATSQAGGFPDPTGRTDRRFRHDDHKFEWTSQEFQHYCEGVASEHGYTVSFGGVGSVGFHSSEGITFATQGATFERNDHSTLRTRLQHGASSIGPSERQSTAPHYETGRDLATFWTRHFDSHTQQSICHEEQEPLCAYPDKVEKLRVVKSAVLQFCAEEAEAPVLSTKASHATASRLLLWSVWIDDHVRELCGGRMGVLIDALQLLPSSELGRLDFQSQPNHIVIASDGDHLHLIIAPLGEGDEENFDLWLYCSGPAQTPTAASEWTYGTD